MATKPAAKKTVVAPAAKPAAQAPKAAAKVPTPKAAAKPAPEPVEEAPEAAAPVPRARGPKGVGEDAVIHVMVEGNPKREGSKAFAVYSLYEDGMTVGEFADACDADEATRGQATPNLVYDAKKGFINIDGYAENGTYEPPAEKPAKEKKPRKAKEAAPEVDAEAEMEVAEEVVD